MHSKNKNVLLKVCSKCKNELTIESFYIDKSKPSGYRSECKSCRSIYRKSYYSNNIEKFREYYYGKRYGISNDQYNNIIKNGCEVCGSFDNLVIDHDHKSGVIRGCLCNSCNCAEGYIKGDIDIALSLIEYIKKHTKK